jgi:hypothetical protein
MLKAVDHLDNVKRVKVSQKDLAPLQKHYQVSAGIPFVHINLTNGLLWDRLHWTY